MIKHAVSKKPLLLTLILSLVFGIYTLWFLYLAFFVEPGSDLHNYFTDTYGILAGLGGIFGIFISSRWGGLRSLVGRGILFLSMGLLFQFLGQLSYTIEFYLYDIENSYPSYGEIFYFGSIFFYIVGILAFAKASGLSFSLKKVSQKIIAILIPLILISISYFMFLKDYVFEGTSFLIAFLDFGYPLGQALYVSLAIVTYFITRKSLGGLMRGRIVFVLLALVFQYAADSTFLYQVMNDTWYAGSFSDYLFLISYFLMSLSLIQFSSILIKVKSQK